MRVIALPWFDGTKLHYQETLGAMQPAYEEAMKAFDIVRGEQSLPAASADKTVVIVAGPNGSGKTTTTKELYRNGTIPGMVINLDETVKRYDDAGTEEERFRSAQRDDEKFRTKLLQSGASFTFETVFSHPSKVDFIDTARSFGYAVHLYFVGTTDPDVNVTRVRRRVREGGHDVPEGKIRSRWPRSFRNMEAALSKADRVMLLDNTGNGPELVACAAGGLLLANAKYEGTHWQRAIEILRER